MAVLSFAGARMAAAEAPVSVTVGLGLAHHEPLPDPVTMSTSTWDAGLAATFGYRLPRRGPLQLTIGGHFALTHLHFSSSLVGNMQTEKYDYQTLLLDYAFAVQIASPPLWVTPWLGGRTTRMAMTYGLHIIRPEAYAGTSSTRGPITWQGKSWSYGATVGGDVVAVGDHHIGVFVDYASGGRAADRDDTYRDYDKDQHYTTWTVGVADRW
ncbi:MAG TPA: hypothetical protein VGD80_16240 [Kofleriaceae bacterium]